MPNIKPISDLRNYTDVLKKVNIGEPVYLTRNAFNPLLFHLLHSSQR